MGDNNLKKVVLVSAEWCGNCPAIKKVLNELVVERSDFSLEVLDADKDEKKVNTLRVRGLPTVLLYNPENDTPYKVMVGGSNRKVDFIKALEE